MQQIHLIKAAQAVPFVRVLEAAGIDASQYSERAGMPLAAINTDGTIGEYALWRFIELAATQERLDFFGYQVASRYPVDSVEGLGGLRMRRAPSLEVLLGYFFEDAQAESTGCRYSLEPAEDGACFRRDPMFGENRGNWQVEQYMITILIQIIRLCAGPKWLPTKVEVSSAHTTRRVPEEWKTVEFTWGSDATRVMIPVRVLNMPPICQSTHGNAGPREADVRTQVKALEITDLVRTQVLTKSLGIEKAARQTGVSVKTLKRKLGAMNLTYSGIVDSLRLELASQRLANSDTRIHVVASELGYEHAANFTRSFKRLSGFTPQEFRNRSRA